MNEKENESFRLAYQFYEKWRGQIIETEDQWQQFSQDVGKLGIDMDISNNPLGWHLINAILDTFNDLYIGGRKPVPAGYFGRDDL